MDFLRSIPLVMDIRETADDGKPIVISMPDSDQTKAYIEIADRFQEKL